MWLIIIPVAAYSVMILFFWLVNRKAGRRVLAVPAREVSVSVIIAVRNGEKTIVRLLESLAAQDYPKDKYEVIVVNDRSTDRTPVTVSMFIDEKAAACGARMRLVSNTSSGKKSALRYGVARASGELLLFTDADCTVAPGWINSFAGVYESARPEMIIGEVRELPGKGFVSAFGTMEHAALQAVTMATAVAGRAVMCSGASLGVRKDVYLKHMGNMLDDIAGGDDVFMLHAVKCSGGKAVWLGGEEAAAVTEAESTAAALLRQRTRWASKGFSYSDPAAITVAAAAAASNTAAAVTTVTAPFMHQLIPLTALIFVMRLIPDYLLINGNYKKREEILPLLRFIISELIYPLWASLIIILSLLPPMRRFRQTV